jgi:nitrate/TMAO reductase-like tetraheme cytochrome c subunit
MIFKTPKPNAQGWTRWQQPNHEGYLLKCCDCGLVHELQFAVVKFENSESKKAEFMDDPNLRVAFKAKRAALKGTI